MNTDENRQMIEASELPQPMPAPELKGRARLVAKFKTKNPDADYDDDEVFFSALDEYDNGREEELTAWRDFDHKLKQRIDAEPRAGQFLSELMSGNDLVGSLINSVGEELTDALNSPEAKAKIDEAREKAQQFEEERQANLEASQAIIDEFLKGKSQEDADAFDAYMASTIEKLYAGKFDSEMLQAFWNGFKHDDDVAEAAEDGEIRGRNESIIAKKRIAYSGDGVPSLASGMGRPKSSGTQQQRETKRSIWDMK